MEDAAGDVNKGNDEEKLQRKDDVVTELRGSDVEPEQEGGGETDDGGAAENRVDTDEQAASEAPG